MSHPDLPEVFIARHGETEWSISGQHTGLSDIPLTDRGERNARSLGGRLAGIAFDDVLTSPLIRASKTCELAGFGDRARVEPDLVEWDYGAYEGKKTAAIRTENPGWFLFRDGCPGGESVEEVGARADRLIKRLRDRGGRILVFSHGHFSRVLASRWLGLPAGDARHYLLSTAALSTLGYEHALDEPVLKLWNDHLHVTD